MQGCVEEPAGGLVEGVRRDAGMGGGDALQDLGQVPGEVGEPAQVSLEGGLPGLKLPQRGVLLGHLPPPVSAFSSAIASTAAMIRRLAAPSFQLGRASFMPSS
jgi:hypothetical protein